MLDQATRPEMARWDILRLICALIGASLKGDHSLCLPPAVNWQSLIEAASYRLVTPALAFALQRRSEPPPAVRDYLDGVLFLNRDRNRVMLGVLADALRAFNHAGLKPVLLKGGANVVADIYPDSAMRLLGDIDLLLPKGEAAAAAQILQTLGYQPAPNDRVRYSEHHHLVPQRDPVSGVTIELHVEPVLRDWHGMLTAADIFAQAIPLQFQDCAVFLPSPTHRVIHTIVHSELSDGNYALRRLDVRQFMELAALMLRYGPEIEWAAVQRRFETNAQAVVLEDSLAVGAALFGIPEAHSIPADGRLRLLQSAIDRSDVNWLMERVAAAVSLQPILLLRIFYPRSWWRIAKAFRRDLQAERW